MRIQIDLCMSLIYTLTKWQNEGVTMRTGTEINILNVGLVRNFNDTIKSLLRIDVIFNNVIALVLCSGILLILPHKSLMPDMGKYHHVFYVCVQFLAAYQILKSAKKSLILPLLTIGVSLLGMCLQDYISFLFDLDTLKKMLLIGLLGMALCTFYVR